MDKSDLFFDYKTMFDLYCVEGKTLVEIGVIFNKTRNQVFNNIKKLKIGRQDYKKQLHSEGKSKCTKCGEIKNLDCFKINKTRNVLNGVEPTCKSCDSNTGRDWYLKNQEITKKRAKQHRENNPERHRELSRKKISKYRKNSPHIHRLKGILSRFIKLTKQNKNASTTIVLGYTYEDFKIFVKNSELPLEGNHVDHKCPISWMLSDVPPSIANNLENLQIITESENEKKSQWWSHPITKEYFSILYPWVKDEYKSRFILQDGVYVDIKSEYYKSN
jgi:hypothetical protein